MDLIVTGATGFLGQEIVHQALRRGMRVLALGRNTARLRTLTALGAQTHAADLSGMRALNLRADALVHCAARSDLWGSRAAFAQANVTGTALALKAATAWSVRRFVHISSPAVLFQLKDQHSLDEETPMPARTINSYAHSKRQAEALVRKATNLSPVILRPRGLYGKGDPSLLPRVIRRLKSGQAFPLIRNGQAQTDLTYISDAAAAALAACHVPGPGLYHISGGQGLTVRSLVEMVADRTGLPARWRRVPLALALAYARTASALARSEPSLTPYSLGLFAYSQTLNIEKAAYGLGWQPKIDFGEGFRRTFGDDK